MLLFIPTIALSSSQTHTAEDGRRLRSWDGEINFDVVNMGMFETATFRPISAVDLRSGSTVDLWEVVMLRPDVYDPSRGPVPQAPRILFTDDDGLSYVEQFTRGMANSASESVESDEDGDEHG